MYLATEDVPFAYRGRLPRFKDAAELVCVGRDVHGRDALLHPNAAEALGRMAAEAVVCGATLLIVSAFRSIDRQTEIVRRKRDKGLSWDAILKVSAYPGFSEHHTGCAVDIGSPGCCDLVEDFEKTQEFRWLDVHAAEFGFLMSYPRGNRFGIAYEPWHWMWRNAG
jgi:zinc D-Ala-D-Ala carboxypeptidase